MAKPLQSAWSDPSPKLAKVARQIAQSRSGPIVDLACGEGRHFALFLSLGRNVIGIDIEKSKLHFARRMLDLYVVACRNPGRAHLVQCDLENDEWPVRKGVAGGVVIVDYYSRRVVERAATIPAQDGAFYLQTFGGQGGNWVSLPHAGLVRTILEECGYEFVFYRERAVGPVGRDAVSVHTLAKRTRIPREPSTHTEKSE
ncbi:class I SAM-dependent methyltransferase [Mesorhizobium sp. M0478]|uniref:class I SAM-dependent methyltransferase n=1 Tax=Mesorhizobium sp. M0478 TaxID=2956947 RepID=UPI00333803DF